MSVVVVGRQRGEPAGGAGPRHHPDRLKRYRAVAMRYDRLAVRYEATVIVAAINEWL